MGTNPLLSTRELKHFSDVADIFPFVIKVYRKHTVRKNEVVATLSDTIGGVIGRLKDGGTK